MDILGLQVLFKAVFLTAKRQLACRLAREFVLDLGSGGGIFPCSLGSISGTLQRFRHKRRQFHANSLTETM